MKSRFFCMLLIVTLFVVSAKLICEYILHDKSIEEDWISNDPFAEIGTEYVIEQKFIPTFENIAELKTFDSLCKYLYEIQKEAYVSEDALEIEKYLAKDISIKKSGENPKILIFHTHSQEAFIDSRPGVEEDTIVGVGSLLADILVNEYGISTVHDFGKYDFKNGEVKREGSYEVMSPAVSALLEKYPEVEVVIDLHRDGVEQGIRLVTVIDGKQTAKIMFVNGITKYNDEGVPVVRDDEMNEYLDTNFAFSLQMQLTANAMYPNFARRIYIKPYRYSLHLLPKSLLVEVGADTNTLEEAKNAMKPLAKVLASVLEVEKQK